MRALALLLVAFAGCRGPSDRGAAALADAATESTAAGGSTSTQASDEAYRAYAHQVFRVPLGHSPALGPPGALVTIVELSELACSSCARVDLALRAIRSKYGDGVRLVWKNKPLASQPAAEPAAQAALEVRAEKGDDAFWQFHDRSVDRSGELAGEGGANLDRIVEIAADAGARADEVRRAIREHRHQDDIDRDVELAEDLEAESTPTLFVNGRRVEGAPPRETLERIVDEEMRHGRELVESGVPAESLYETIVASGPGPWEPAWKPLVALPPGDPTLGSPSAAVTVHVWGDYQCARCLAVERLMSSVRAAHGDRVRFVWHDLPLARHTEARRVALAAREAQAQRGAAGFWDMHDRIARHPDAPTPADLDAFARAMGLDARRWTAGREGAVHARAVEADERAARDEGITETPAFLVVRGAAARGMFVGHVEYGAKLGRAIEMALDDEPGDER
jgi:protein-disulfide isomerase